MRSLSVALALVLAVPAAAQPAGFYGGLSLSRAPLASDQAGSSVILTAEADQSPVPSLVQYPSESIESAYMVGAQLGVRPARSGLGWKAAVETSLLYGLVSDSGPAIDVSTLEVGGELVLRPSPMLGFALGLSALGAYADGEVGTVGTRAGDVYLIAPEDGQRYETGSTIRASAIAFGGDATVDLLLGPLSAGVGYRLATPVDKWEYRVQDNLDPERSSSLPASGFAANPPVYDLDGLRFRLGLTIPLGPPSR